MSPLFRKPKREDGMDLLMRAILTGSPSEGILSQESDGQKSFVNSETLPTDMQGDAKAVLEAAGVKFLAVIEDDPISSMWNSLTAGRRLLQVTRCGLTLSMTRGANAQASSTRQLSMTAALISA